MFKPNTKVMILSMTLYKILTVAYKFKDRLTILRGKLGQFLDIYTYFIFYIFVYIL